MQGNKGTERRSRTRENGLELILGFKLRGMREVGDRSRASDPRIGEWPGCFRSG